MRVLGIPGISTSITELLQREKGNVENVEDSERFVIARVSGLETRSRAL